MAQSAGQLPMGARSIFPLHFHFLTRRRRSEASTLLEAEEREERTGELQEGHTGAR